MTAKKKVTVFQVSEALAASVQETIPATQMKKLDGAQSQKILQAIAQCAGQVISALEENEK